MAADVVVEGAPVDHRVGRLLCDDIFVVDGQGHRGGVHSFVERRTRDLPEFHNPHDCDVAHSQTIKTQTTGT